MYYKLAIYIYTFVLILSLFLFYRYLKIKNIQFDIPTRNLYRDDIKTGDIFLVDWQRVNNIFLASLFSNSFMHPAIALWDKGDLFMIELINYFDDDNYKGLIKIPFNKWYRINKKGLILYNKLKIAKDSKQKREEIAEKILNFYTEYKGKMGTPNGLSWDWTRFWFPQKDYQPLVKFDNIICTEVIAMLIKEVGIAKKDKSVENYMPDSFIGMRDFALEKGYSYKNNYLVKMEEL